MAAVRAAVVGGCSWTRCIWTRRSSPVWIACWPRAPGRTGRERRELPRSAVPAALTLFAEQGFRRTTVGQIERAAGFTPRGGAMYKHFAGKDELLHAALDQHARHVDGQRAVMDLLPLGDLAAELTLIGRYLLAELSGHREVTALIEKEGAQLPELARQFWRQIAGPGFVLGAQVLERQLKPQRDQSGTPGAVGDRGRRARELPPRPVDLPPNPARRRRGTPREHAGPVAQRRRPERDA